VGMPEGELNPYGRLALALKLRNTRHDSFWGVAMTTGWRISLAKIITCRT